ncbi:MAG: hypothetical protein ACHQK9_13755 [Reyranellales bacterium]
MRTPIIAGAAALALSLLVAMAHAETVTLSRAGSWEAFGGTTHSGLPVCGVSTSGNGKYFGLKQYSGQPTFTIQVGSTDWKIADRQKATVIMRLDANTPWTAAAVGMHFSDGDPGLEYSVDKAEIDRFLVEFRNSSRLQLQFPNTGLADLAASLAGTSALTGALQDCIRKLK